VKGSQGGKSQQGQYDPICGTKLERHSSEHSSEYRKRRYYFCSHRCKAEFDRAAERIRISECARAGALFTQGKVRWGLA
jgi:YHS domain-containing protein